MTTLRSVVARLASVVRCAGIAYVAVQVAIWHSFYAADPWRLTGPVAATGWALAAAAYLRRRPPIPLFACIDTAFYVVLALSVEWCVPAAIRDDAFSWLVIVMSGQILLPAWFAPAALAVPLAAASPAAYWIGAEQMTNPDRTTLTTAAIVLIATAAVHICGRRQLFRRTAALDAALDQADRDASGQYAILSRNIERREHERLLHDTVLNTLTALAWAGGDDVAEVRGRCRQDVARMERALSDPEVGAGQPDGGLMSGVQAVAAEMRTRGLTVHVEIAGQGAPAIPAPVAAAISNAAREALSNVAAHAGTAEAWVKVSRAVPGGDTGAPDRVQVIVRDRGRGFDLARVDQFRLGLRRSIAERIADCGGQALIRSAPGQGTVVCICWPGPAEPARAGPAGRTAAPGSVPW